MNPFLIYLWGIADSVGQFFAAASVVMLVACVMVAIFFPLIAMEFKGVAKIIGTWFQRVIVAIVVSGLIGVLIPDSKTIAAMVVIPVIAESDAIREDIPQLYGAAIEKLKESLELNPAVEKP